VTPIVGHLDLDAFFAAVEELENPELRGRPLVVGGDPHGRGVVSTASYAARRFGVVSAMPCAEALRRCPHAIFVRPRMSLYREYSRDVWSIVRDIVPTVEQTGIDEGYLDLGEVAPAFDDARALAEAVQAVVRARTRLSCSLGVATSKVVAKVASDRRKPGGLTVVRPGREAAFLANDIGAKLVIPCHYEMFAFNTASPEDFMTECERLGQPYKVLRAGERWSIQ